MLETFEMLQEVLFEAIVAEKLEELMDEYDGSGDYYHTVRISNMKGNCIKIRVDICDQITGEVMTTGVFHLTSSMKQFDGLRQGGLTYYLSM